jgi:hypothetical protein
MTSELPLPRDMPRVQYSGRFEPERIPAANGDLLRRSDVNSYGSSVTAKAAAYHPWGRVFLVTAAAGQLEAEQQALDQCNIDPDRKGRDGPCYLYAAGNQVLLPQRLTKPRPVPQTISEAFAYLAVPTYSHNYFNDKSNKAIAIVPESGQTFRWDSQQSAAKAEQFALEGCQLAFNVLCVPLASNESLLAPDPWKAPRRDMKRLHYSGKYKEENVPLFFGTEPLLRSYSGMVGPKAMVIRANPPRVRIATGKGLEEAQAKALAACHDDGLPTPCFVYAINNRVILEQHRENRDKLENIGERVEKIEADMKPLAKTVANMEPIVAGYIVTRWKIAGAFPLGTTLITALGWIVSLFAGKIVAWMISLFR